MTTVNTLWVFIYDSKSNDKKHFLTMFIVTESKNFDKELQVMKNKLRSIKNDPVTNNFLNLPKYHTYMRLGNKSKHLVDNILSDVKSKIIEHSFFAKKIIYEKDVDFYYKDHIKQIALYVLEKYQHKYKQIVFDHSSNSKINDLIVYENKNVKIRSGNDNKDSGLIFTDLLRSKLNYLV